MHTQIPLIFLQKMDLLLKKTPQDEVKRHILPMILASLETENRQVQVRGVYTQTHTVVILEIRHL